MPTFFPFWGKSEAILKCLTWPKKVANAFLLYNSNWRNSSIKNIVSYLKLWQMYMKTPPWSLWHLGHRLSLINWQRKISKCYMHLLSFSPIFFQFEANQKPFRNALPDPKKVVKAFIQSGNGNWDIFLLLLHKIVKKNFPLWSAWGNTHFQLWKVTFNDV